MTIKLNSNLYNWFFIYNQIVRITETKEAKKNSNWNVWPQWNHDATNTTLYGSNVNQYQASSKKTFPWIFTLTTNLLDPT